MSIQLSDHFTFGRLLRFTIPSIIMMIFTSIYSVVDALFVSNFVGKTSFAAVNLITPVLVITSSVGFMIGSGGSARVAMLLGERKTKDANLVFSMLIYVTGIFGIILSILGFIFMDKIAAFLGAEGKLSQDAAFYGRLLICACPFFMMQNIFQSFLVVAEKPKMGLVLTIGAGITNIILDALFIVIFKWGLLGAALATCISQVLGGGIPLLYFCFPNKTELRFGKFVMQMRELFKACTNGSSELVTNISVAFVSILYNYQLIKIAGENGIASYGALMYVSCIFAAVFIGYGIGTSPVISYHYGAENKDEVKNLLKKNMIFAAVSGIVLFLVSEMLSSPVAKIFTGYDDALFEITKRAFVLYSFSYIFAGLNTIASAFFTALNNGFVSALISFSRTFVFNIVFVFLLPLFFLLDGIWLCCACAEICTLIISLICVIMNKKKYGY